MGLLQIKYATFYMNFELFLTKKYAFYMTHKTTTKKKIRIFIDRRNYIEHVVEMIYRQETSQPKVQN